MAEGSAGSPANLRGMLASVNLQNLNFGPVIFATAVFVSVIVGPLSFALGAVGNDRRYDARTWWGRTLAQLAFYAGWVGMAAAAVVLVAGTWVGFTARSPLQRKVSAARLECRRQAAKVSRFDTRLERDAYIRGCVSNEVD